jgi:molybdenum cofactor cytidylyltransferase
VRFGPVPLDQAPGAILAHGIGPLKKGRVLTAEDLPALQALGLSEVTVARLDPGDLAEDPAAAALGEALSGGVAGLRAGGAGTGRVNLYATQAGLLMVDAARVDALNAVNPMITLATLRPFARVAAGTMVGTVKIIAYAVPAADLDRARAAAAGALSLATPAVRTATLIETLLPGQDPGPKGRAAMADRLARLEVRLTPPVRVAHQTGALAGALAAAPGEAVFVLTASATSDPGDTAPAALIRAGGHLIRFGMPVDPGNLLFLGQLRARPVIGLPGCARSPALNGADWVMERVLCGLPVSAADIARMGVGGLLKEMPSRPRKREPDSDGPG